MKRTLLENYVSKTTFKERNTNPRTEGIIATLSDIIERDSSFENLPKSLEKMQEFHRLIIDRSKVKDNEELERVATTMTLCFSMMVLDKHITKGFTKN